MSRSPATFGVRRASALHALSFLLALGLLVVPAAIGARAAGFTLPDVLGFPFPSDLTASPAGSRPGIAWVFMERGVRNVWVAEGPDYAARRLTDYREDDGQEIANLSLSADGNYAVYVRGGDHGANWPAGGNLMPDPASSPVQPQMGVWAAATAGGAPTWLGAGDEPAISPQGDRVAFLHDGQVWIAPIDGSKPAARWFFARGTCGELQWAPDGRSLAFVLDRGDHSFITVYAGDSEPLRYLAPSTTRDSSPRWSPDGRRIAFVREPGRGGPVRPLLGRSAAPWAIRVADAAGGAGREVWNGGESLPGSYPATLGGANLNWAAGGMLVFLADLDGWPHLYSIPVDGGEAMRLTSGNYMVEYVGLSPDRRWVVYNANTGGQQDDIDRRHVFRVPVDTANPEQLTSGRGIEWAPVITADGKSLAYLGSTAQVPPLPFVQPIEGGLVRGLARDRLPADFPSATLVTPTPVVVRSSDGQDVHGQVFRTAGGAARRPAIVYVHGGPPRQMLLGWHYSFYYANAYAVNQYLASRGFLVLAVNYRLGIGYGESFQRAERAGARGASEYLDVLAAGKYLQGRDDVDPKRIGIWGGSYGGYLTALALGRNSDVFAAGVDIHGVHDMTGRFGEDLQARAEVGDGITSTDLASARRVAWDSSPIAWVGTWKSPVLLIHGDDDRNVQFHSTVDLVQRLTAAKVPYEEIVIPDEIHDFLLYRSWLAVDTATAAFFEKRFQAAGSREQVQR
jgi:dipeptidyl aminopeptidase/acylaminoacyl peptidase